MGRVDMQTGPDTTDPWAHMVGALSLASGVVLHSATLAHFLETSLDEANRRASIECMRPLNPLKLVERPDALTATITWRDPTHCCYIDQIWRATRSRVKGICALSGREIRPRDEVFKPGRCRTRPANAQAMILAEALNDMT
jgi:hypothetical protein